jgi:hypothetical protein
MLSLGGPLALSFAPFLLLLFPTGHLPSHRWQPLAWIAAVSGAVLLTLSLFFARPDKVAGAIGVMTVAVASVIFAAIVLSALSLVMRYRRASGVERQQLKWVALAAVLNGAFTVALPLGLDRLLGDTLWNLFEVATWMSLYVAVGVAILRYRLYDIDILINRALVYGPLTAMLVLVYVVGVVSLQYAFRTLTGQESQVAIVASTLAIAALFNPLRKRVQAFVDRRFYRRKYDAAKTLEAFSARLRDETDVDALTGEVVGVVRETMQPAHVSLWLRPDSPPRESETQRVGGRPLAEEAGTRSL